VSPISFIQLCFAASQTFLIIGFALTFFASPVDIVRKRTIFTFLTLRCQARPIFTNNTFSYLQLYLIKWYFIFSFTLILCFVISFNRCYFLSLVAIFDKIILDLFISSINWQYFSVVWCRSYFEIVEFHRIIIQCCIVMFIVNYDRLLIFVWTIILAFILFEFHKQIELANILSNIVFDNIPSLV